MSESFQGAQGQREQAVAIAGTGNDGVTPLHGCGDVDIESLSQQQQQRVTAALDAYLRSLENGEPFDRREFASDDPAIREMLDVYLETIDDLYGLVDQGHCEKESIPTTLGEFTLVRQLGRGGMGIVYEAIQSPINRRVALKLLPLAGALDQRQIARFKNEARAAGALQHPNIVAVHSVGQTDGVHYYAMQLIDGEPVDQGILRQQDSDEDHSRSLWQSSDWRRVVSWAIDTAEALHAAHETGVIHRDVKPSNLIVDREGKIWVTDFGLARTQSEASLTRSGDVIGTMRYMSPEQAGGQSALVDGRSDVYSLAVTVYEMLTLRQAYPGEDAASILKAIDRNQVTGLNQVCKSIPRDLQTVIEKAMASSRDLRYETAEAFAEDLKRVLQGEATRARPPSLGDHIIHFAAKHRRGMLLSGALGVVALIGFAISMASIAAQKQISDRHAQRAQQSERLAREAVDRLGGKMAELLSDVPSAQPIRRQLLRETLTYYQTFAEQASNDPELRRDLAVTYGKIGTFQDELSSGREAVDALTRSEQLYGQLARETPWDPRLQLDWSISQNNLAQSLHRAGELEKAAVSFTRAIETQERLARRYDDSVYPFRLSTTLNNLGLLLADADALSEAEDRYQRSIRILRDLKGTELDSQSRHQLGTVLSNRGAMLSTVKPQVAIESAREALAIQTKELTADKGNADLARQVVITLQTLGMAYVSHGEPGAAIKSFEEAAEMGTQLLVRWPDQPRYRSDFVITQNHLGLALSRSGRLAEARVAFNAALDHQRGLQADYPNDAETQSMLGGVLNNLGFIQNELGDRRQAIETYAQAVKHQSDAVSLAPHVDRYQGFLRKHRYNLDRMESQQ